MTALALFVSVVTISPASPALAISTVIDDFEDGDASDWGFFGGNAAGGGGGALSDRPQEGSFYLSTGWGGEGSNSGFYGGFFKNLDNAAQITPPADPVFGVWVLNQSDATVDQYTLEITIREDLDGNGWTDGSEDSFRLDTTFTSASFDDQWTLVSAPLSDFANLGTGGDGTFNGNLDEVVVVVSGVQGGSGSTVEVDFDAFVFTTGGPTDTDLVVFDDMEHGDPFNNGWFSFGGSVGGGGISPNGADLPATDGGAFSLETGWGSGGVPGFFGGFGRSNPIDLSGTDHFNLWINPDADQDYTLEINLQDDDDGDGAIGSPADDEFQFNCTVSPSGPCALSGAGWQQISIPLADFFDDNSFLTGGNGVLDAVSGANGGNGELVNVVVAVIGNSGSDVNFRTDYWAFSDAPLSEPTVIIDDFEDGLPSGTDGDGIPIGFFTFSDGSPISIAITDTPPAPLPGSSNGNNVLAMTGDVASFAGFIHGFENGAIDTWVTQDWSGSEGLRMWVHGLNTGTTVFVDVIDNRNPGSTSDDAERFTVSFTDDFSGWQPFEFPFSSFARKEIGNGAPNDGFTLTQVHGWALGTLNTPGEVTYYVDDVELYGVAEVPPLSVNFASANFDIEEGTTGAATIKLNRPLNADDPAQVSVDFSSEPGLATPGVDYIAPAAQTLTFVNGGPSQLTIPIETIDDTKFEGDERVILRLSNPVDVEPGFAMQARATIVDNDPFDPNLIDDFENGIYLWDSSDGVELENRHISQGDGAELPGQGLVEGTLAATVVTPENVQIEGRICNEGIGVITVRISSTDTLDVADIDHTTVRLGDASETHVDRNGEARRHEEGDELVLHFRFVDTGLPCDPDVVPLTGLTFDGESIIGSFWREFSIGQDWTGVEALGFWWYGDGSGDEVTLTLRDNRAPDPGPNGWSMVWADEFNEPAGTAPNPDNWGYEIGDGSVNGIPGWGNDELQYYTDSTDNAATDGSGNLVITAQEADGEQCYYGPCDYTSARLVSKHRAEFAYGRIESRILVPDGEDGLWPAFWSLGTDIDVVDWPQTGEIDFMEYVSRLPDEIFGTIHGPGYSGGQSFGDTYEFGEPVSNNYHNFAIEWEPDLIKWYVDDILYHTATPADVAPNQWVFNDPVYLLMNLAVGGNFGGALGDDLVFPQSMAVDYVRVYQGPDTAERWETSFTDDTAGWRQIEIPFTDFSRSDQQPSGAPDDGLGLSEVWGYGFTVADGGQILLDQVRLVPIPPPTELIVTTLADSGEGSLREALGDIAADGTITFDPALAGGTIALTSGQLVIDRSVTIDGSGAPGLAVSGNNASRVVQIAAGTEASINDLVISDGVGAPQGGGILNYGILDLERVIVSNNTESSGGGASFDLGGGGIYNGDGATLNLLDSTVSDNATLGQPGGGIYGFFNSTLNITNSTVSGNVAGDVAGGLRALGNVNITNSTISGNTSTAWHGGAAFLTDGATTILNSTIVGNNAPGGTTGGLFVGTFGPAAATLTLQNSIVADNGDFGCLQGFFGAGAVTLTSLGNNVFTDATCNPIGSGPIADQVVDDAGVAPLANNGGPTETHALLAGSPAIDMANTAACPATDQRGVARDAACDVGAYEAE